MLVATLHGQSEDSSFVVREDSWTSFGSNLQSTCRPTTSNLQTVIQALPWYLVPGAVAAEVLNVKFVSIIQAASLIDRHVDSFLIQIDLREKSQTIGFCFVSKE